MMGSNKGGRAIWQLMTKGNGLIILTVRSSVVFQPPSFGIVAQFLYYNTKLGE